MRFTVPSIVAFASSVYAVGNAVVINKTPGTFYLWSVGDAVGPLQTIGAGKSPPQ
jgi:hypothetical protein